MNNVEVAQAFANGATSGKSGNMFIDGDTVYSYGYHFPIAKRLIVRDKEYYLFTGDNYSSTTARHKSHVRQALSNKIVIEAYNTGYAVAGLTPEANKRWLSVDLGYLMQKARDYLGKANRTRTKHMYELWRDTAWNYENMADYAREIIANS